MLKKIAVEEAKSLIRAAIAPLYPIRMPLSQATGRILAEPVFAPINVPAFPQAGMDGYAFVFEPERINYTIVGEVAAGNEERMILKRGEAVRIFTGAPVPSGADTVVMQEKVSVTNGILSILDSKLIRGQHYRPEGSDIAKGDLAIAAGHRLSPASIGFLAALGYSEVLVHPAPKVAVIVTGNELQEPGRALNYGQVYEANSYSLRAALSAMGINSVFIEWVTDEPDLLQKAIHQALQLADLVLITGGVSVGDYDFTWRACEASGVKPVFHGVRQKPGKPLLFGMRGHKPVFGLPGNPSSVLTCFYQYVYPAIGQLMNQKFELTSCVAHIGQAYQKPAGITHFLRASLATDQVDIRRGQESYRLQSFMTADALIVLPEHLEQVQPGDEVRVEQLPV